MRKERGGQMRPVRQVEPGGKLAVVGWGSTYGPIHRAVDNSRTKGMDVSHIHVRHIWPLPKNLGDLLRGRYRFALLLARTASRKRRERAQRQRER